MKKILFLILMIAGCTPYHQTISSYNKIDLNTKTVMIDSSNRTDIYQEFKQILTKAGFSIYNQNNEIVRYKLSGNIIKDDAVRCGLWEDGYTYDITFTDTFKKAEVFGMQGQGCRDNVLKDFTALVNNRYDEKAEAEPDNEDTMKAPILKSDGRTWWSN